MGTPPPPYKTSAQCRQYRQQCSIRVLYSRRLNNNDAPKFSRTAGLAVGQCQKMCKSRKSGGRRCHRPMLANSRGFGQHFSKQRRQLARTPGYWESHAWWGLQSYPRTFEGKYYTPPKRLTHANIHAVWFSPRPETGWTLFGKMYIEERVYSTHKNVFFCRTIFCLCVFVCVSL